jgi:hypothetical protein
MGQIINIFKHEIHDFKVTHLRYIMKYKLMSQSESTQDNIQEE